MTSDSDDDEEEKEGERKKAREAFDSIAQFTLGAGGGGGDHVFLAFAIQPGLDEKAVAEVLRLEQVRTRSDFELCPVRTSRVMTALLCSICWNFGL